MGLVDRILGRSTDLPAEPLSTGASRADNLAVAKYERMLRTAPADTIEKVHIEAFEKLTPEQLDILFDHFSRAAENDSDKPEDAQPTSLAKAATRAETRKPGAIRRVLSGGASPAPGNAGSVGMDTNTWLGLSLLDTIATYSITTAIWGSWYGYDADAATDGGIDPGADGAGDGGFWDFGF